jgi:hypothetical protein
MNTFLDYLLGTIFAVIVGIVLALVYIFRTGGF